MKNQIVFLLTAFFLTLSSFSLPSVTKPDDIIGVYWSPKKDGKVEIFKKSNKYYGKTICCKNRKDIHNPDPKLRDRDIIGLVFLQDFEFDGDDEWINGTVYDPQNGKTYSCKMWLENGDLQLKGYIGISLIGRTETLERVTEK